MSPSHREHDLNQENLEFFRPMNYLDMVVRATDSGN